jgi:hypothetical protein
LSIPISVFFSIVCVVLFPEFSSKFCCVWRDWGRFIVAWVLQEGDTGGLGILFCARIPIWEPSLPGAGSGQLLHWGYPAQATHCIFIRFLPCTIQEERKQGGKGKGGDIVHRVAQHTSSTLVPYSTTSLSTHSAL